MAGSEGNYLILSTSEDRTIRSWSLDGQILQTFRGHQSAVNSVLVTIHNMMMTGSDDQTIKVWNLRSGKEIRTLGGFSSAILSIALRQTKPHVVSVSFHGTLSVSDWQTGECLATLACQEGPARSALVTPDDRYVIFAGWTSRNDPALRVVRLDDMQMVAVLEGHAGGVNSIALTPAGQIISCSSDATIRIWDAATRRCLRVLTGHAGPVSDVEVISAAGRTYVVSVSADDTLKIWDADRGRCLRTITLGHWLADYPDDYNINRSRPIVALVPSGLACTASTTDYLIKLWDLSKRDRPHMLDFRTKYAGAVTDMLIIEDYRRLSGMTSMVTRLLRLGG